MSGLENIWLAVSIWGVAVIWLVLALITWQPVQTRLQFLVRGTERPVVVNADPNARIEKGFLDFAVDAKRAGQEFPAILTRITRETTNIAKKLQSAKERTHNAAGDLVKIHNIASRTAGQIDEYSAFLESNLNLLQQTSRMLTHSWIGYIEWFTPQTEAQKGQLLELRPVIRNLLESTRNSPKGVGAFRDAVAALRGKRISQDINRATERLLPHLDGIIAVMKEIERTCVKLLSIINKKL